MITINLMINHHHPGIQRGSLPAGLVQDDQDGASDHQEGEGLYEISCQIIETKKVLMMQSSRLAKKGEGSDELNCFIICRNMKEKKPFRVNSCKPSYPPSSPPLYLLRQDQASFNY